MHMHIHTHMEANQLTSGLALRHPPAGASMLGGPRVMTAAAGVVSAPLVDALPLRHAVTAAMMIVAIVATVIGTTTATRRGVTGAIVTALAARRTATVTGP